MGAPLQRATARPGRPSKFFPPSLSENILTIVVTAYGSSFGLTKSRGEARRLIEQGSVQLNGEKIRDPQSSIVLQTGDVLRLDKTRAVRVAEANV